MWFWATNELTPAVKRDGRDPRPGAAPGRLFRKKQQPGFQKHYRNPSPNFQIDSNFLKGAPGLSKGVLCTGVYFVA
jgi:hypothetical protein